MYFFVHQEQPQPPTGQLLPRDHQQEPLQEPLQQDNHSADLLQQHRQLLQLGEMLMKEASALVMDVVENSSVVGESAENVVATISV